MKKVAKHGAGTTLVDESTATVVALSSVDGGRRSVIQALTEIAAEEIVDVDGDERRPRRSRRQKTARLPYVEEDVEEVEEASEERLTSPHLAGLPRPKPKKIKKEYVLMPAVHADGEITVIKRTEGVDDAHIDGLTSQLPYAAAAAAAVAAQQQTSGAGQNYAQPPQQQDFSSMDTYPLTTHLHNTNSYVYGGADNGAYSGYYPYHQQSNVHSPTQSSYLLSSAGNPGSPTSGDDDSSCHLGHAARASPQTLAWLTQNYETAEGTSLPRCTLYNHYKSHCAEHKLEPVNAASFGKLIRSVFFGLKTRRLGTRGNSKYHYYGIRIKPDSPLNRLAGHAMVHDEYIREREPVITRTASPSSNYSPNGGEDAAVTAAALYAYERPATTVITTVVPTTVTAPAAPPPAPPATTVTASPLAVNNAATESDRRMLGDGEVPRLEVPNLDGLEDYLAKLGLTLHHTLRFIDAYIRNCEDVLFYVKQLQFDSVEECWSSFWQADNARRQNENGDEEDPDREQSMGTGEALTQQQLFSLCTVPQMQQYISDYDFAFYQVIVDVLVADVLSSRMTATLTSQIRTFAKGLEASLKKAMHGAPEALVRRKCNAVRVLAQTLRRYTSLNHLAQAARSVLQRDDQIQQMYQDFNKVETTGIQDQAGWVCSCDATLVQQLQQSFREQLNKRQTLEEWADWLEAVVDQTLAKYHDKPLHALAEVAKQFLLNWSFYSSMIIRDLTLRSAQSFGSFHLIRLLFDEYMLYLVELRLAKAANRPALAVMSQQDWMPTMNGNSAAQSAELLEEEFEREQPTLLYVGGEEHQLDYIMAGEQDVQEQVVVAESGEMVDLEKMIENEEKPKVF